MKTHTEWALLKPCIIKKDDLIALVKLVQDGFPPDHTFSISVKFGNVNSEYGSVDELFASEGLPKVLDEVYISALTPHLDGQLEVEKSASINLMGSYSSMGVVGADEIWVMGKYRQLAKFFEERRRKTQSILDFLQNDLVRSAIAGLWLVFLIRVALNGEIIYSILFAISSIYLGNNIANWAGRYSAMTVTVVIEPSKTSFFGLEIRDLISIFISILALLVSIVQLLK